MRDINDIMEDVVDEERGIQMAIERLESSGAQSLYGVVESIESGFGELSEQLSEITSGTGNIASILEWGFEGIEWKLDQTRGTRENAERRLKTPSQTQANEQRGIAEKLRGRGVLGESEKFFLRSLDRNPLDYRTYIGLGKTYLQMGKPGKARTFWIKSLPHAPKIEIDYRSYSYRLIGRSYFCEHRYQDAALELWSSITLSPNYYLGHYDLAQYCALIGEVEDCRDSLWIAVLKEPIPIELIRRERNFRLLKEDVEDLLNEVRNDSGCQYQIERRKSLRKLGDPTFWKFDKVERKIGEVRKAIDSQWRGTREANDYLTEAEEKIRWVYNITASPYFLQGEEDNVREAISSALDLITQAEESTVEARKRYRENY